MEDSKSPITPARRAFYHALLWHPLHGKQISEFVKSADDETLSNVAFRGTRAAGGYGLAIGAIGGMVMLYLRGVIQPSILIPVLAVSCLAVYFFVRSMGRITREIDDTIEAKKEQKELNSK